MALNGKFKIHGVDIPFNGKDGSSTDSTIHEGCSTFNLSAEFWESARFEIAYQNDYIENITINGSSFQSLFSSDSTYTSASNRLTRTAASGTLPIKLISLYSAGTAIRAVTSLDWFTHIPVGVSQAITWGFQRAIWYIGRASGGVYAQAASHAGYGKPIILSEGDVLVVEKFSDKWVWTINDIQVHEVPLEVIFSMSSSLGTVYGGVVYGGQEVVVTTHPDAVAINTGDITASFLDGTTALLHVSVEKFEIQSPISSPETVIIGHNIGFTSSTVANWSDGSAGGIFLPDDEGQTDVIYHTAGMDPGTVTITATCSCDTDEIDTFTLNLVTLMGNITPTTLTNPSYGCPYSAALSVTGNDPFVWTVLSGALPPGLAINSSTGAITGTPTSTGSYSFTIQVVDDDDQVSTRSYSVVVNPANVITMESISRGVRLVPYSQQINSINGTAPITYAVASGALPAGTTLNASTGVISGTPSTAATYNFTISTEDANGCGDTASYTVVVYNALTLSSPTITGDCFRLNVGQSQQFSITGGSGGYTWSVNGDNTITSNGLLTAVNPGEFTITVIDTNASLNHTIQICIGSQNQFCVTGEVESSIFQEEVCCQIPVECGQSIQLSVPSFHLRINGEKQAVDYLQAYSAIEGDFASLRSITGGGGATANKVSFANDEVLFEIVTNFDMAQTSNGTFEIGWSESSSNYAIDQIEHAVAYFTDSGVRKVELRHSGAAEAGSAFTILQGDSVSFGTTSDGLKLYLNSVEVFVSGQSFDGCDSAYLVASIATANKTIGGPVDNLTWNVVTSGGPSDVGIISGAGLYNAPSDPNIGTIRVEGTVNSAKFKVDLIHSKPSLAYTIPDAFLVNQTPTVWIGKYIPNFNEPIRLAADGSPDAIQNGKMIDLGTLEASAKFTYTPTFQDFDDDEATYRTALTKEEGSLQGSFLQVRDYNKMSTMIPSSTLESVNKGVRELSIGGKACSTVDLRAILVVESTGCSGAYDVLYLPRVQNKGPLTLEYGRKANGKFEFNFTALLDYSRPKGKRLFSLFQIEGCAPKVK